MHDFQLVIVDLPFLFFFFFSVKYSRDPANFYAAKLQDSFEKDDTDTAGRIILTSTTVCY